MREFRFVSLGKVLVLGDTWRCGIGGWEEDGGGVVGDGEGLAGGERGEGGAGDAEGAAVVGVSGGEVVAGEDGVFDETTSFLAAADGVFVVEFGGCAAHGGGGGWWVFSRERTFRERKGGVEC